MSRTDKTNPWWVKAEEWEPVHHTRCVDYGYRRHWQSGPDPDFVCDLPKDPVVRNPRGPRWRVRHAGDMPPPGFTDCTWEPVIGSHYGREGRKIYGVERSLHVNANLMERSIRAQWRKARGRLLGTMGCCEFQPGCHCGLDEDCIPDPRHRHYAIWDRF